jgi:ankyrin repeat protein
LRVGTDKLASLFSVIGGCKTSDPRDRLYGILGIRDVPNGVVQDPIEASNNNGETPLDFAVFYGNIKAVSLLLWLGAKPRDNYEFVEFVEDVSKDIRKEIKSQLGIYRALYVAFGFQLR